MQRRRKTERNILWAILLENSWNIELKGSRSLANVQNQRLRMLGSYLDVCPRNMREQDRIVNREL